MGQKPGAFLQANVAFKIRETRVSDTLGAGVKRQVTEPMTGRGTSRRLDATRPLSSTTRPDIPVCTHVRPVGVGL